MKRYRLNTKLNIPALMEHGEGEWENHDEAEASRKLEFAKGLHQGHADGMRDAEFVRNLNKPAPDKEMSEAPCKKCGYNGPGYYQPETHPCADKEEP